MESQSAQRIDQPVDEAQMGFLYQGFSSIQELRATVPVDAKTRTGTDRNIMQDDI